VSGAVNEKRRLSAAIFNYRRKLWYIFIVRFRNNNLLSLFGMPGESLITLGIGYLLPPHFWRTPSNIQATAYNLFYIRASKAIFPILIETG